ncbi:MAG: hypothetical protein QMC85_04840 [Methanocellales archaeon]|nr:hypothetical protein [Methanocellales archaeon]MDI6859803.1 hypothetical protein [Methanocellales archaeon]MDI6902281.1 hypothetical protein [Methanocellales archaeon]
MSINIRDANDECIKSFKAEAKRKGLTQAQAFESAVKAWLLSEDTAKLPLKEDPAWKLLEKPLDFGIETDATKVDDLIYGD